MTDPWWGSHYLTPSYTYKTITAADPWLLTHAVANSDEGPSLMAASTLVHPRAPVRGRRSRCPEGRWAAGRNMRPVVAPARRSASPSFGDNAVAACCRCQRQQQAKGSQSMRGRGGDIYVISTNSHRETATGTHPVAAACCVLRGAQREIELGRTVKSSK
jgi:hypothetical protein